MPQAAKRRRLVAVKDVEPTHAVVIRMPDSLLRALDGAVGRRTVRIPRHTWLLEAVAEKLKREGSDGA